MDRFSACLATAEKLEDNGIRIAVQDTKDTSLQNAIIWEEALIRALPGAKRLHHTQGADFVYKDILVEIKRTHDSGKRVWGNVCLQVSGEPEWRSLEGIIALIYTKDLRVVAFDAAELSTWITTFIPDEHIKRKKVYNKGMARDMNTDNPVKGARWTCSSEGSICLNIRVVDDEDISHVGGYLSTCSDTLTKRLRRFLNESE